ncbi:hypothetical protein GCM10009811_34650 [Nostocoides veronense]|uniref:Uncharacterized protein n=1 Tax=Nostocoides veronense TaxID=330836 RepID=A0ABP4Y9Z7_9MICO
MAQIGDGLGHCQAGGPEVEILATAQPQPGHHVVCRARSVLEEIADASQLARAWDDELEIFRYAGEGAPVRWLHKVG